MEIGPLIKVVLDRNEQYLLPALDGLSPEQLRKRPTEDSNPIGWLTWHMARVMDRMIPAVTGTEQLWLADGWHERFGRGADPNDRGNGDTPEQVGAFDPVDVSTLLGYYTAVRRAADTFLDGLTMADLNRPVPDVRGDGTVPLAERLPGLLVETLQHSGQAAYVRGLVTGKGWMAR